MQEASSEGLRDSAPPRRHDPRSPLAPGGLLAYSPNVPDELVFPKGGMDTNGHIALINFQLRQIRSALALAHALGRTLILPEVTNRRAPLPGIARTA